MKTALLFAFFGIWLSTAFGQASPQDSSSTYAIVIGISDYQDPAIPDLLYADKDAIAFANYLRSPGGGSIESDHINLLTNEAATMAQVCSALEDILTYSHEGDKFIFYFNGHGDVEGRFISQPGYLLCYDAPFRAYMAGGTIGLLLLKEVVNTLTIQNKANVTLIADVNHAGNLAGSGIGGSQITATYLAQPFTNEIKFLSCRPEEHSLEGAQWAGGHGVFTYYLIKGLAGQADRNRDKAVTLYELDLYLGVHVNEDAAPLTQIPMVLGNMSKVVSYVSDSIDIESIFNSDDRGRFAEPETNGGKGN